MKEINENSWTESYWSQRYRESNTGWDIGHISTPLKEYFDQLENKDLKILIPGCGNAYEAEYLFNKGFRNVHIIDLSELPLNSFAKKLPEFPREQLIQGDFFDHNETYDLIVEQTFFCALDPSLRQDYVKHMHHILKGGGKLVGLLFNIPLFTDHPPFGGNIEDYRDLFKDLFRIEIMETAYNSIEPRKNNEAFIKLVKV